MDHLIMAMKLYDSLSSSKQCLLREGQTQVNMYVCGLTVYDAAHIGHLRCMLVFDLLVRVLRRAHLSVKFVRNITDVDDKIIHRSNQEGRDWRELVETEIGLVRAQEQRLNLIQPDHEPRASDYIPQMIEMIQTLEEKGFAYVSTQGDVCFSVHQYKDYGALSGQNLSELISDERQAEGKVNDADFVLWKKHKPGEPSWPSPWGEGRPGWHIECSAMAYDLLGGDFDLHGGGVDLKFPHHENEIAQSKCATGCGFAKHWMHVGPLRVNGTKMSKSLGNFITIDDALVQYHPELLKLYLLKTHYRQPLNYEREGIEQCQNVLLRFYLLLWLEGCGQHDPRHDSWRAFNEALMDDLNVAPALTVMHELMTIIATSKEKANLCATLRAMGEVLGILQDDPQQFLNSGFDQDWVQDQILIRNTARKNKNFIVADQIRDELGLRNIVLIDTPNETKWYNEAAGIMEK